MKEIRPHCSKCVFLCRSYNDAGEEQQMFYCLNIEKGETGYRFHRTSTITNGTCTLKDIYMLSSNYPHYLKALLVATNLGLVSKTDADDVIYKGRL